MVWCLTEEIIISHASLLPTVHEKQTKKRIGHLFYLLEEMIIFSFWPKGIKPNNFLTKKLSLSSSLAKVTTKNGQLNESENTVGFWFVLGFFLFCCFFSIGREITDKICIWHPFFTADSQSVSIFQNIFISVIAIGSATQYYSNLMTELEVLF